MGAMRSLNLRVGGDPPRLTRILSAYVMGKKPEKQAGKVKQFRRPANR